MLRRVPQSPSAIVQQSPEAAGPMSNRFWPAQCDERLTAGFLASPGGALALVLVIVLATRTVPAPAAQEKQEGLLYREVFPSATGAVAGLLATTGWHANCSGKDGTEVLVASEPGGREELGPISSVELEGFAPAPKRSGHLHACGGKQDEVHVYWSEEYRVERPADATLVFSWHQCFDKGRDGAGYATNNTSLNRQTIARLAVRISDQWYVSRRLSSVYQERSGVWERKTFVMGGEKLWSKVLFDGRKLRRGFEDVPELPAGAITAFGIYNDQMAGDHRIDAFEIRLARWDPSAAQPEVPGTWPQYKRNAARAGDAPEERLRLPLARVAAIRFPHPIYASPAVVDGSVFVQDAAGNVACLDYRTNRLVWTTNIGGVANHSSPAVARGRVFVGSSAGHLAILDATTGKLLKKVPGPGGVIAAPAIEGSAVYYSTFDGELNKIDFDGNVIWTHNPGPASIGELAVRGSEILFCAGRPSGGTALERLVDLGDQVAVANSQKVYCPSSGPMFGPSGTCLLQQYDAESGSTQLVVWDEALGVAPWTYKDLNDSRGTPSVRGKRFYRGDKCFALDGGEEGKGRLAWQADPDTSWVYGGGFHSSPALSEQHQVIGAEDGRVYFFRLNPKQGSTPRTIKPAWVYATDAAGTPNGAVSSSPAVADGRVFFGGEDGVLYVLGHGKEATVVDVPIDDQPTSPQTISTRTSDFEWHTAGGDMGYSFVSPDQTIYPPFRIKWKTRVWGSFKGPIIVAEGLAFCANRLGQVAALDAETGRIVWRTTHPRLESRPGPTYADGKLLVLRGSFTPRPRQLVPPPSPLSLDPRERRNRGGGLWCHDAKTGRLIWQKTVPFAYHFNADGLVVQQGKVLVAVNGGGGAVEATAYSLADGKEVWNRRYEDLLAGSPTRPVRICNVAGDGRWYVSAPAVQNRRGAEPSGGVTLAVDPGCGDVIWTNTDYAVFRRSRIAFRNGLLVVFTRDAGEALEAATGEHLWTGHGRDHQAYKGTYYQQPLADLYLDSHGTLGACPAHACSYSVFANGAWYGNRTRHSPALVARVSGKWPDKHGATVNREIWEHPFSSNACPSPSPAYGRLYYAPNGEGVVYCFEPDDECPSGD